MKFLQETRRRLEELRGLHDRFGELIHKERGLLLLSGLALAGEILFQLLAPWPLKYIFDGLLLPQEGVTLFGLPAGFPDPGSPRDAIVFVAATCFAVVVIAVGLGSCSYYRQVWSATAGQRMVIKLRKRLYQHLHRLSLRFHYGSRLGDLLVRITGDIGMLRDALSETIIDLVGRAVLVVSILTIMIILDVQLALVAVAVLVAVAGLSTLFGRRILKVARKQREQEGVLAYTAGETLSAIALVKAYGREEEVIEKFARQNRTSLRKGLRGVKLQASLSRWVEFAFAAGAAVVLAVGAYRVWSGTGLLPGDLLVFVSYVRTLNKPLRRMSRISARIGKAAACGERILEVFAIPPEENDAADAVPAPPLRGRLELEHVTFAYDDEGPSALRDVSFVVEPGETVAIAGRNGAGKSTLVQLLLRFFEPTEGRLLFDGVEPTRYTLKSLRDQISITLQQTYLLAGTVRENLQFAAPDATDEEMLDALALVGADFVASSEQGLELELEESGANLSGGERRKLALAGTILRRSPILVLDEPTTGIDRATRDEIISRLPDIAGPATTLVITHDPELLRIVDRVLYLEDGLLVGAGTHAVLQDSSSGYRALFPRAQAPKEKRP